MQNCHMYFGKHKNMSCKYEMGLGGLSAKYNTAQYSEMLEYPCICCKICGGTEMSCFRD